MLASIVTAAAIFSAPVPAMNYDWFSGVYDWPNKGVQENTLVNVGVDVTVNPYGYMQSCISHVRSGIAALGPYVCSRLGARAEFDPAHDPAGHHMYGIYRTSIILWKGEAKDFPKNYDVSDFTIPKAARVAVPENGYVEIQFAVDEQGRPSSCSLVPTIGYGLERKKQQVDPALVKEACAELPAKMHPEPARDREGHIVPSVQSATVAVR